MDQCLAKHQILDLNWQLLQIGVIIKLTEIFTLSAQDVYSWLTFYTDVDLSYIRNSSCVTQYLSMAPGGYVPPKHFGVSNKGLKYRIQISNPKPDGATWLTSNHYEVRIHVTFFLNEL